MPNREILQSSSQRAEEVRAFVKEEFERYRRGELPRISSASELAQRFGYRGKSSIRRILRESDLSEERKRIILETHAYRSLHFLDIQTNSQRQNEFIEYLKMIQARIDSGEDVSFPSASELSEQLGYSPVRVYALLKQLGLSAGERRIEDTRLQEQLTPSYECAWMMGILASSGQIAHKEGKYIFSSNRSKELREMVISRGQRVFNTRARVLESRSMTSPSVTFNIAHLKHTLGDFRGDTWVDTLVEKYQWLFKNNRYMWAFIEGLFDTRGDFEKDKWKIFENIKFYAYHRKSANFLCQILVELGIENLELDENNSRREGIFDIRILSLKDRVHFARNVHSVISEKEERLEYYRSEASKALER